MLIAHQPDERVRVVIPSCEEAQLAAAFEALNQHPSEELL
jgi:hypothetical protein